MKGAAAWGGFPGLWEQPGKGQACCLDGQPSPLDVNHRLGTVGPKELTASVRNSRLGWKSKTGLHRRLGGGSQCDQPFWRVWPGPRELHVHNVASSGFFFITVDVERPPPVIRTSIFTAVTGISTLPSLFCLAKLCVHRK